MNFKKGTYILFFTLIMTVLMGLNTYALTLTDGDIAPNMVSKQPRAGQYTGVDVDCEDEDTSLEVGTATTAEQLKNPSNGDIKIKLITVKDDPSHWIYSSSFQGMKTYLYYNGKHIETINSADDIASGQKARYYYVKKGDSIILAHEFEHSGMGSEWSTYWSIDYKKTNRMYACTDRNTIMLDLSDFNLGNPTSSEVAIEVGPSPCHLGNKPWDPALFKEHYNYIDKGGVYDLGTNIENSFAINTLTGKVFVLEPNMAQSEIMYKKHNSNETYDKFKFYGYANKDKDSIIMNKKREYWKPIQYSMVVAEDKISIKKDFHISFDAYFGLEKGRRNAHPNNLSYDMGSQGNGMVFFLCPHKVKFINNPGNQVYGIGYTYTYDNMYPKPTLEEEIGLRESLAIEFDTCNDSRAYHSVEHKTKYLDPYPYSPNELQWMERYPPYHHMDPKYGGQDRYGNSPLWNNWPAGSFDNHISIDRNLMMNYMRSPRMTDANGDLVQYVKYFLEDGKYHHVDIIWDVSETALTIKVDNKLIGTAVFDSDVPYVGPTVNTSGFYYDWNQTDFNGKIPDDWDQVTIGFTSQGGYQYNSHHQEVKNADQIIKNFKIKQDQQSGIKLIVKASGNTRSTFALSEFSDDIDKLAILEKEAINLYQDIGQEAQVANNGGYKYKVGDYPVNSKSILNEFTDRASKYLNNSFLYNADEYDDVYNELKEVVDWIKESKVTENNKITINAYSGEYGELFWSEDVYAPQNSQVYIRALNGGSDVRYYVDASCKQIVNGELEDIDLDIDITDGTIESLDAINYRIDVAPSMMGDRHYLYDNPDNRGDVLAHSKDKSNISKKMSKFVIAKVGNKPKQVNLMYRWKGDGSVHNFGNASLINKAKNAILRYGMDRKIDWMDGSHYDYANIFTSDFYEKQTLINILKMAVSDKVDSNGHNYQYRVYEDFVDKYIYEIKNGNVTNNIKIYEMVDKYYDAVSLDNAFYGVTSKGDVSTNSVGAGVTRSFGDQISLIVPFSSPDNSDLEVYGSDAKFIIRFKKGKYFDINKPDIMLYKFDSEAQMKTGLSNGVQIPANIKIKNQQYDNICTIIPEKNYPIDPSKVYAIKFDSRLMLKEDYSIDNLVDWYNQGNDKVIDPATGVTITDIKPYQIQYAIDEIKDPNTNKYIHNDFIEVDAYPSWFDVISKNIEKTRKVKINLSSREFLSPSF